jgi:hypothetical protein
MNHLPHLIEHIRKIFFGGEKGEILCKPGAVFPEGNSD